MMIATLRPDRVAPVAVPALLDAGAALGVRLAATGGVDAEPAASVCVTGACLDSRAVRPGDLYAALPGAHTHGAAFVPAALEVGAAAILTDPAGAERIAVEGPCPVPILLADDPRAALGALSARVYGRAADRLTTVGITGTNGKTTTAYLLDAGLAALGRTTGLVGTIETRVGAETVSSVRTTPESCDLHGLLALMLERGVDVATMEVSSHALCLHRVDGVRYDVVVFTNLSQDHLDFHGTMDAYFAAKASLFTPQRAGAGVVCVDDAWGARLAAGTGIDVVTLASAPGRGADWEIHDAAGPDFTLVETGGDVRMRLRSALPGDFNRTNTALAALVLLRLGVGPEDVASALRTGPRVPGRAEPVDLGAGAPRAIVDFAHTPEAVAAVLRAMRAEVPGPLVAVLGAGGDRDPGKRPAMGAAAAAVADVVVVTDDNPRAEDPAAIREAVLSGALRVGDAVAPGGGDRRCRAVAGREAGIETALRAAGPDGLVAVLGKGHETGQEIRGVVHPFDDRTALRAAWGRVAGGHPPRAGDPTEAHPAPDQATDQAAAPTTTGETR